MFYLGFMCVQTLIFILCFLSVCLYPITVKTTEPIGPKFFCGTSLDPMEGLWMIKFSKICLLQNSFFENPRNILFVFVLQCIQRENVHSWKSHFSPLICSIHNSIHKSFLRSRMNKIFVFLTLKIDYFQFRVYLYIFVTKTV